MYILHVDGSCKQGRNLGRGEARNATTYLGDEEGQLRVHVSETDELLHIGQDGVHAALHRRDGIALSLQTHALTHDSTEFFNGYSSCATGMHTCKVAAEDENLVVLKAIDMLRRDTVTEFAYLVVVFGGAVFPAAVGLALCTCHGRSGSETH